MLRRDHLHQYMAMNVCWSLLYVNLRHYNANLFRFSAPFDALRLNEQKNFTIPAVRTWYEDTCIPASELPSLEEVLLHLLTHSDADSSVLELFSAIASRQ